jgi:hypothetical protein
MPIIVQLIPDDFADPTAIAQMPIFRLPFSSTKGGQKPLNLHLIQVLRL